MEIPPDRHGAEKHVRHQTLILASSIVNAAWPAAQPPVRRSAKAHAIANTLVK